MSVLNGNRTNKRQDRLDRDRAEAERRGAEEGEASPPSTTTSWPTGTAGCCRSAAARCSVTSCGRT